MNDELLSELKYAGNYHPKKALESARRAVVDRINILESEVLGVECDNRVKYYEEEIKELKLILKLYDRVINTLIVFRLIK